MGKRKTGVEDNTEMIDKMKWSRRDAKPPPTYKPGLEECFGQKLRSVLLLMSKLYILVTVLMWKINH